MMIRQKFINETFKFVAILESTWSFIFSTHWLTIKTYWVLYLISTGINTSKDLLAGTHGTRANMAKKIKFLEENGLIQRAVDGDDKRIFHFSLTKKATDILQKISPVYDEAIRILFSGISEIQLQSFLILLDTILKNLEMKNK